MKNKKLIALGMGLVTVMYITGIWVYCSERQKEGEAMTTIAMDYIATEPEGSAETTEPEEQAEVTEPEEETAVQEETADNTDESDVTPVTMFSQEEYYYTAILKAMITEPTIFWDQWDAIENMNIPENNRFAIIDINADGVKELLVEYDITSVIDGIFKAVDIYTEDMHFAQLGDKLEFYTDGTILDYDQFRVDYDQFKDFQYITFYKHYDIIANMYIWDESMSEEIVKIVDREFPEDMDSDHDGKIYVWSDYSKNEQGTYDTVESYLTEEEFNAKMKEMLAGKEKIEIPWQNITETNLLRAADGDARILDSMPTILGYIYDKAYSKRPETVYDYLSFYHFYYYFLNINNDTVERSEDSDKNIFRDLLPSAQWVAEDEDCYVIFNVDFKDIEALSEEGFREDITMDDFTQNWEVTDAGDGTVDIGFDTIGMHDGHDIQILEVERAEDKIRMKGVCNRYIEASTVDIVQFDCTLQENANSPLDGYTIVDFTLKEYPRIPD